MRREGYMPQPGDLVTTVQPGATVSEFKDGVWQPKGVGPFGWEVRDRVRGETVESGVADSEDDAKSEAKGRLAAHQAEARAAYEAQHAEATEGSLTDLELNPESDPDSDEFKPSVFRAPNDEHPDGGQELSDPDQARQKEADQAAKKEA